MKSLPKASHGARSVAKREVIRTHEIWVIVRSVTHKVLVHKIRAMVALGRPRDVGSLPTIGRQRIAIGDEEGQRSLAIIPELEIDLAEAVAGDLAGHLVVLAQGPAAPRAHAGDERIKRALAPLVPGCARAPDDLQRAQTWLLEQQIDHKCAEWLRF